MSAATKTVKYENCNMAGCSAGEGPWCARCGFNKREDERRKKLPLVEGTDGICRKLIKERERLDA